MFVSIRKFGGGSGATTLSYALAHRYASNRASTCWVSSQDMVDAFNGGDGLVVAKNHDFEWTALEDTVVVVDDDQPVRLVPPTGWSAIVGTMRNDYLSLKMAVRQEEVTAWVCLYDSENVLSDTDVRRVIGPTPVVFVQKTHHIARMVDAGLTLKLANACAPVIDELLDALAAPVQATAMTDEMALFELGYRLGKAAQ